MITEKLFYKDNHMKNFTAQVLRCTKVDERKFEIVLDKTAFFPEGGGQPADTGKLGDVWVTDVFERDGEIVHVAEGNVITEGEIIEGKIDWVRRFDMMQQHSGEHIVSGLIHKKFGLDNVGFHLGNDYVTLDMNGVLNAEQLSEIEYEANAAIWENVTITASFPSPDELEKMEYRSKKALSGEVRIVNIEGYDTCACCGVHVSTSGEIGLIKLTDCKKYKGGVRITMLCGARAIKDYQTKQNTVSDISHILSAKPDECAQAVDRLQKSCDDAKYKLNVLEEKLIKYATEYVDVSSENICIVTDDISPEGAWKYALRLSEKCAYAAVFSKNGNGYTYAIISSDSALAEFCRQVNAVLSGRGGGKGGIVRGNVTCNAEDIRAYFEKLGAKWSVIFGN